MFDAIKSSKSNIFVAINKESNILLLAIKQLICLHRDEMKSLLQQLKKRRLDLGLKQNDMMMRVGISRQQYQHLESKGNPTLKNLELIATGLNSEIVLVPGEKLKTVLAVLNGDELESENTDSSHLSLARGTSRSNTIREIDFSDDPWQGLLGEDS